MALLPFRANFVGDIPLALQIVALFILLILSGFFAMSETALMAANRYRLRSAAQAGQRGAVLALKLLSQTDRLFGIILLGNNLINAACATLVSVITIKLFGNGNWALGIGTLLVTFLILVFAEITPKVIGANHADRLAGPVSYVLSGLLYITHYFISFINLFVTALLKLMRLHGSHDAHHHAMSPDELRALVLESGHFIPAGNRSILLNLFELSDITVEDVMTPRGSIEALDISAPMSELRQQLATCFHTRLPVFDEEHDNIIGILHIRRFLAEVLNHDEDREEEINLRPLLSKPYFVPAQTPVFTQLREFQQNQQRMALVVDEYGEIQGLLTVEDIIEELIGKFTTSLPGHEDNLAWEKDGSILVDGAASLRSLNRSLNLNFSLDGPKTLNGLILEYMQDIPESDVSMKIDGVRIEVVHTQDTRVKTARLFRP